MALTASTAAANADTYDVNADAGNDSWTGLCETWDGDVCGPKKTIQAALTAARSGDTVVVADGAYTGSSNRNLNYGGKGIHLQSANGPERCIIDCNGANSAFNFKTGEDASAVVEGFTIT
jgi:hypothetical protein